MWAKSACRGDPPQREVSSYFASEHCYVLIRILFGVHQVPCRGLLGHPRLVLLPHMPDNHSIQARLPARAGGDRPQASGYALPLGAVRIMAEGQEPGLRAAMTDESPGLDWRNVSTPNLRDFIGSDRGRDVVRI